VKTLDELDPESLEDVKWYASVEDQIPNDVVPPAIMTNKPEPSPEAKSVEPVVYPKSEILEKDAAADDGFTPSNPSDVEDAQNE